MKTDILVHVCISLFAVGALAAKPLGKEVCGASCYYSLLKIKYASDNVTEQTLCTHPLRVTSTYYCVDIHCEEADITPGIEWWAATCKKSKKLVNEKAYRAAIINITDAELASLPTVNLKEKAVFNETVVPSASNWLVVHRSVSTYSSNRTFNHRIRWVPYGFWALVLLIGIGSNALGLLRRGHRQAKRETEGGRSRPMKLNKFKQWIKVNVLMSPTFSLHHHQPWGWFTVPLRLQSIVIVSYLIIHIALIAVHYRIYEQNYYYASKKIQVLRYLGDRVGILATSSIPLLFLFGGRGNIFIMLTGWSYRTFNIFHRWIARLLIVEMLIHGVVLSAFDAYDKGWSSYREKLSSDVTYKYGVMTGVAMGLLVGLSSRQVRKQIYEFFKLMHIALAVISLVAFYEHIKDQFSGSYRVWVWLCVGIWGWDHTSRFLRIALINYKAFVGKDTMAEAYYSEETGMIRLQVYPSATLLRHTPGTYYQLWFPGGRIWESHPFTLAGWASGPAQTAALSPHEKSGTRAPGVVEFDTWGERPSLTFMIRPQNGMTRRLRDKLQSKDTMEPHRLRVLLEGPYGTPVRLDRFDNILFIVGGSGITTVLPYLRSLFEDKDDQSHIPNVKLDWTVRKEAFVRDVLLNDLRTVKNSACARSRLREEFYITDEVGSDSPIQEDAREGGQDENLRLINGRPDVAYQVSSFLQESEGRSAVFVCGPAEMADSTRAAVVKEAGRGVAVDFFEELYGW